MNNIRVVLVDDHELVRASLTLLLGDFPGIDVVADVGDGRKALDLITLHKPDIVLMDISMAGLNGIEATRQIVKEHANVRVIILSMHSAEPYVLQALRAGAVGYVLKESAPRELELAIAAVARGDVFLSPMISKHVLDVFLSRSEDVKNSIEYLTPRQREVLQLIAEGKSSKQIAVRLETSVKTVESHRASLMERLDIHEIAGLVRFAIRNGVASAEA
jgi:DNA-binding NarL/FixJ family response regulator